MTDLNAYNEYCADLFGELYVVQSFNPEVGEYDVADIVSDPRKAIEVMVAEMAKGMRPMVEATYIKRESEAEYEERLAYEDWVA